VAPRQLQQQHSSFEVRGALQVAGERVMVGYLEVLAEEVGWGWTVLLSSISWLVLANRYSFTECFQKGQKSISGEQTPKRDNEE
jgi:hypothetical protein